MERTLPGSVRRLVGAACAAACVSMIPSAAYAQAIPIITAPVTTTYIAKTACLNAQAQSPGFARPVPATVKSAKSAAILGGEMSALDRIRMQQAGTATSMATNIDEAALPDLAPAAGGIRTLTKPCFGQTQAFTPGTRAAPITEVDDDSFLASRRTTIGKTKFDRDWKRVRSESLGRAHRRQFSKSDDASIETVEKVNRWVNRRISFVEDRDLFGRNDYWAGARLTLRLGKGDCEDYALTKMQLLAAAGISRDDMFLTIARDTIRKADHAVLVVRIDDRFVVLDNATDALLDGAQSHEYVPFLSFNNRKVWLHGD